MVTIVQGRNSSVFRALHDALSTELENAFSKGVPEATSNKVDRATEWPIHWSVTMALDTSISRIVYWDEAEDVHPALQDFLGAVEVGHPTARNNDLSTI